MCKLNILCKEIDGKCSCSGPNSKFMDGSKPINGILASIINYVKSQPEIMRGLTENPASHQEEAISLLQDLNESVSESPPTQAESQEGSGEYSISLVSHESIKVVLGKPFSLILQLTNQKFEKVTLNNPLVATASIVNKFNNEEKLRIGQVETTGTIFFKNLLISEEIRDSLIIIKINHDTALPFIQEIKVKQRKKIDFPTKKTKISE